MKSTSIRKRVLVAAALAVAFVGASSTLSTASTPSPSETPSTVAAANTHWRFTNQVTGDCLAGEASGAVTLAGPCNRSKHEWDWITSDSWEGGNLLMNAETGLCLTTNYKPSQTRVWSSTCDSKNPGQRWRWDTQDRGIWAAKWDTRLRGAPGATTVHTDVPQGTRDQWSAFIFQV
ncbi:RICIN domain-containing protein [Streptomyces sp. NBC_01508]|uniref:RICIN domain-containing protein n=1 Tax=Streptomyces sp. NBC_01508 TaxID=2903888 RepID=UPI00386C1FB0